MTREEREAVIEHVRALIARSGLPLAVLAEKAELSKAALYQWRNGEALPSPANLRRLGEVCAEAAVEGVKAEALAETRRYCLILAGLASESER